MIGLTSLWLEVRIRWYEHALRSMGPLRRDVPEAVHRLRELIEQRPPVVTRIKSRCEAVPGLCAGDPRCPDRRCPGLHQRDGGHHFAGGVAFPIEHKHF